MTEIEHTKIKSIFSNDQRPLDSNNKLTDATNVNLIIFDAILTASMTSGTNVNLDLTIEIIHILAMDTFVEISPFGQFENPELVFVSSVDLQQSGFEGGQVLQMRDAFVSGQGQRAFQVHQTSVKVGPDHFSIRQSGFQLGTFGQVRFDGLVEFLVHHGFRGQLFGIWGQLFVVVVDFCLFWRQFDTFALFGDLFSILVLDLMIDLNWRRLNIDIAIEVDHVLNRIKRPLLVHIADDVSIGPDFLTRGQDFHVDLLLQIVVLVVVITDSGQMPALFSF